MIKKIAILAAVFVVVVLLIEAAALLHLKSSIDRYADYWQQRAATKGEIAYLALGDSAAQGVGASAPEKGYVGLLAEKIKAEAGKSVRVINLSKSGATINDVIEQQLPQLQRHQADLVTLDIGGNDVAGAYNSAQFKKQFNQLAQQLPPHTYVANIPYFNGRIRHNQQAIDASRHIAKSTRSDQLELVDLQNLTRERDSLKVYAADYFHPSDTGYKNWADAFWQVIKPNL